MKKGLVSTVFLIMGFVLAGCNNGTPDPTPESSIFLSSDDNGKYTLEVTENMSEARYIVKISDAYILKIEPKSGSVKYSRGTVRSIGEDGLELKPSNSNETFNVDVSTGKMMNISGKITYDDDTFELLQRNLTPEGAGSATKFEGIWKGTIKSSNVTRLVICGDLFVQQFLVDGKWENEGPLTTFTFDNDKIYLTDSDSEPGDQPKEFNYNLSDNTLTVAGIELTKQ